MFTTTDDLQKEVIRILGRNNGKRDQIAQTAVLDLQALIHTLDAKFTDVIWAQKQSDPDYEGRI